MIGGFLGKRGASRLLRAISRTVLVPSATGAIQSLPAFGLKTPVAYAKTGGNANLTVVGGAITAAAAITVGVSQTITGTATGADGVVLPWSYTCTGQPAVGAITANVNILAPAGTVVAAINGVPAGATPVLSPNDGRFVIAGNQTDGWRLERGPGLVSVSTFNGSISAPGVASGTVTISLFETAGLAFTNPRTDANGVFVIFDVSGGTWNAASGLLVDPSKVTVSANVASVDASGVTNNITVQRAAGLRAEIHQASPLQIRLWLEDRLTSDHSNVTVAMAAGAITSGTDASATRSSTAVTNNALLFIIGLPAAHIHSIVSGRNGIGVEDTVQRGAWRAEGVATHPSTIAGVEWTITKPGQSPVVTWQGEERGSWYQDKAILSDAQWEANAALRGAEAGLGVWPSPPGNAATDPTGVVTVQALFVPKNGGRARGRTITWRVISAQAGAYPERNVWLDTVAGSDANDGLSLGTPKLTLAAACNTAGSATSGATQTTVPIVNIIGGTSVSPRDIDIGGLPVSGSGAAIPSGTDSWLYLRPAAGYARDTIRLNNHAGVSTGIGHRIRRLAVQSLTVDISDGPSGTSSKTLWSGNTSVYPMASNPQSHWFDDVLWTHRGGKVGQLTEGNNGNFISGVLTKLSRAFWTRWTHTDTGQRGIQAGTTNIMRDVRIVKIQKDALKQPDCIFGFYIEDNAVDPVLLPVNTVTGTITAGDTVTGVYSWPAAETVSGYTAGTVRLAPGGNSYSFKPDDSKTHVAITITGEVGSIVVGETIRNAAGTSTFRVYRRDGNILRGAYIAGSFSNGNPLTGVTSGATCTVGSIANAQVSLFFSPSGARAAAAPPHPDGLQIQSFYPSRIIYTPLSGTFVVGETLTVAGVSNKNTVTAVAAGQLDTAGNALYDTRTGQLVTGDTSGATGTITTVYSILNDANVVLANGIMRRADGQLLFGENGAGAVGIVNVIALKLFADSALVSQFANISGLVLAHCTLPTQSYRVPFAYLPGQPQNQNIVYNIFADGGTDHIAVGAPSGDDKGKPGIRFVNHMTTPIGNSGFSSRLGDAYVSRGDPIFVNGHAWNENDTVATLAKNNFRPTAPVPAVSAVPIGKRHARFDIRGVERVNNDWSGAVSIAA